MVIHVVGGLSAGTIFVQAANQETEVAQGGDHYHASLCQAVQMYNVSHIASALGDAIPNPSVRMVVKVVSASSGILSFVVLPTCVAAQQGDIETDAYVPTVLSEPTKRTVSFLADHSGKIVKVAMVTVTVAMPVVGIAGGGYYAAAALGTMLYQFTDSMGIVPRGISRGVENYLPACSSAVSLFSGGIVIPAISALHLSSFSPTINQFFHQKIDQIFKRTVNLGPTRDEVDAPVRVKKKLSFQEINEILDSDDAAFDINAAHCSKSPLEKCKLPKSLDFSQFETLFNKFEWSEKYNLLLPTFKYDKRFLKFLKELYPKKSKKDFQANFEFYVGELAKLTEQSNEDYLADQLKKQMSHVVMVLRGQVRAKGSQFDVDEAIHNCAIILGRLLQLDVDFEANKIEIEDILLKLAVEGGEYCARGLKRASKEIVDSILESHRPESSDPASMYEWHLTLSLERLRTQILTCFWQQVIGVLVKKLKKEEIKPDFKVKQVTDEHAVAIAEGVHIFDIYRIALSLGFVPLTEIEKMTMGLRELLPWYELRPILMDMYKTYKSRLIDAVKERGEIHFGEYIRGVIQNNPKLSPSEKEKLIDKFIFWNDGKWTEEDTMHRFHRLMFKMLDVLKRVSDTWVIVDDEELQPALGPVVQLDPLPIAEPETAQKEKSGAKSVEGDDADSDWELVEEQEQESAKNPLTVSA